MSVFIGLLIIMLCIIVPSFGISYMISKSKIKWLRFIPFSIIYIVAIYGFRRLFYNQDTPVHLDGDLSWVSDDGRFFGFTILYMCALAFIGSIIGTIYQYTKTDRESVRQNEGE